MDRERLWWSVNGERGQMPTFKASSHDYKRTDDLPDVDIESINQILAQRLQARTPRRESAAPGSSAHLGAKLSSTRCTDPASHPLSLSARPPQARITRDFATADQLRVDLRRMGVEVDDKARTFTCVSSGGGGGGRRRNDDDGARTRPVALQRPALRPAPCARASCPVPPARGVPCARAQTTTRRGTGAAATTTLATSVGAGATTTTSTSSPAATAAATRRSATATTERAAAPAPSRA